MGKYLQLSRPAVKKVGVHRGGADQPGTEHRREDEWMDAAPITSIIKPTPGPSSATAEIIG